MEPTTNKTSIDAFKGALLPLPNTLLLIPNLVVVEVMGTHHQILAAPENTPDWFEGVVQWNGLKVPLISFEKMIGVDAPEQSVTTRLVILNAIGGDKQLKYMAALLKGIPTGIDVNPQLLHKLNHLPENPVILSHVRLGNIQAIIPNLVVLEDTVLATGFTTNHVE